MVLRIVSNLSVVAYGGFFHFLFCEDALNEISKHIFNFKSRHFELEWNIKEMKKLLRGDRDNRFNFLLPILLTVN